MLRSRCLWNGYTDESVICLASQIVVHTELTVQTETLQHIRVLNTTSHNVQRDSTKKSNCRVMQYILQSSFSISAELK